MLFLADADHWGHKKAKWTRRYLLGHRRILKKGDFITPPVNPFFQKENGGLKCNISKPPSSLQSRTASAQVLFDILNRFDNVHFCNRAQRDRRCQQAGRNRNHSNLYNRHDGNGNKL